MRTNVYILVSLLLFVATQSIGQTIPPYVPTNGLVGWWGFNGDAQDESGNGNHGTVHGATLTMDRLGNLNAAYDFNGSSSIAVNDNSNLRPDHITISAWVYATGNGDNPVVTKTRIGNPFGLEGGEQYTLFQGAYNQQVTTGSFQIKRNGNCINGGVGWSRIIQADSVFEMGAWQLITATYDGFIMKLYKNGNLIGSHSPPPGAIDNCSGGTLNFGRYWDSNFFNGKIDDIGIWNRALNQQEINSLFGLQPPIQMSALCLPTIITTTPISVGIDSAIVGGNIIHDGGSSIILKGVCYSTSPRPHMGSLRTEDGAGNGPYSSILRGLVSSTAYYARSYAKNSNGVVVYGNEVNFTTSLASPGVRCPGVPTVSDIDGNVYNTVLIGSQCWIQSNLKTSRYRNGDSIQTGLSAQDWGGATTGAYAIYDNNMSIVNSYGYLYNWYTALDSRGVCPINWHVPTDKEWNDLVLYLDPFTDTAGNWTAVQSTIAGGFLKSTGLWASPNTGASNSSGFSSIPAGHRAHNGTYYASLGERNHLWSSSMSPNGNPWLRAMWYDNNGIYRANYDHPSSGISIRCIKNTLPQVNTTSINQITATYATANGELISEGDQNTVRGFCYSTAPNPTILNDTVMSGSGLGAYSDTLIGLNPITTYYVRAFATNGAGTVYGNQQTFNTTAITVGASYLGGIVFYVDGTGSHGLICAPFDQGQFQWGCYGTDITGTSALSGHGLINSNLIQLACTERPIAASICGDLVLNGFTDWYLPSLGDLQLMYSNLRLQNLGDFSNTWYWSSYQFSPITARAMNFANGNLNNGNFNKVNLTQVRAVRSF
jgi:uncharacterized protein (TIGR02145 family)